MSAVLPNDDDGCGWWRLLPPPTPALRLTSDISADAVVVGAGFTGLAAARRMAELRPNDRIVVVEAQRAGYGASGRNSGFAGAIAHRDPTAGLEDTLRARRLCDAAIGTLGPLVLANAIECGWTVAGRVHAAVEEHAQRNLDALVRLLEETGEPHTLMNRDAVADALGTTYYQRGVHIQATILMQPAALVRGLARSLPQNVTLYEESPVLAIERGVGWTIRAARAAVNAPRLLLAVNGCAPALGLLRRKVFPLYTFASVSRPLTDAEQHTLGSWRQWGLVSEDRMGTTLRRTADQRLLVRNSVRYEPSLTLAPRALRRARDAHRRSVRARWPILGELDLEYTWGGVLGMTMNQGHFFGELGEGLYAFAGCNGTGVALGTACGMALAELALGVDSDLVRDARTLRRASWLPPEPFLGWGVRATLAYLQSRAGRER